MLPVLEVKTEFPVSVTAEGNIKAPATVILFPTWIGPVPLKVKLDKGALPPTTPLKSVVPVPEAITKF